MRLCYLIVRQVLQLEPFLVLASSPTGWFLCQKGHLIYDKFCSENHFQYWLCNLHHLPLRDEICPKTVIEAPILLKKTTCHCKFSSRIGKAFSSRIGRALCDSNPPKIEISIRDRYMSTHKVVQSITKVGSIVNLIGVGSNSWSSLTICENSQTQSNDT